MDASQVQQFFTSRLAKVNAETPMVDRVRARKLTISKFLKGSVVDLLRNTDIIVDTDQVVVTFVVLHERFNVNRGTSWTTIMLTEIWHSQLSPRSTPEETGVKTVHMPPSCSPILHDMELYASLTQESPGVTTLTAGHTCREDVTDSTLSTNVV